MEEDGEKRETEQGNERAETRQREQKQKREKGLVLVSSTKEAPNLHRRPFILNQPLLPLPPPPLPHWDRPSTTPGAHPTPVAEWYAASCPSLPSSYRTCRPQALVCKHIDHDYSSYRFSSSGRFPRHRQTLSWDIRTTGHNMNSEVGIPPSPRLGSRSKRRSNISTAASTTNCIHASQSGVPMALSRRSSQSSLRSVRTVATTFSVNSTATSASVCSAKFERAYASQAQEWTRIIPNQSRRPSMSSQYSATTALRLPPHVYGKSHNLQKQLKCTETLLREIPNLNPTETGSIGWLLMHERHLLKVAIKYDERAQSEWEAAQDWQSSAQEGPVSKIFVTQPSRFGLTPQQHKHRLGQAMTLGNNALDLWRFSDLSYQDAYRIRGAREKLQAEQGGKTENVKPTPKEESDSISAGKIKGGKKDFQTWLKEVSRSESLKSIVVKDDGTINKLEDLTISDNPAPTPPILSKTIPEEQVMLA